MNIATNRRVLVIDDNRAIHEDFRKILGTGSAATVELLELDARIFDAKPPGPSIPSFVIESAYQGRAGLDLVREANATGHPYAVAFVDMRMPPGWDGVETIRNIRAHDPDLQIVACTAYSDYSWTDMAAQLAESDGLLILKKPFDCIELVQMANALTEKWSRRREFGRRLSDVEAVADDRARELVETNDRLRAEILERKEILRRLVRSEVKFKTLVERSPDPTFVHRDLVLEYVNPAMKRLLGYEGDESLRGRSAIDVFIHPDDREMLAGFVERTRGQSVNGFQIRWVKRDGSVVLVEASRTSIAYDDEPATLVIASDVTEKLRAETEREETTKALRLSEERYRILFEHGPLSITLFDPSSLRVLEVNGTAIRLYGYTREEFLTKTIADLKVPEEMPELVQGMASVRAAEVANETPQPWRGTRLHRKKDGTHIHVEITAHPVLMGGRRVMLAIGADVTEARRLEEHVRQAQKMEAIGGLAAGIAHDFNNILSVILSYSELLATDLKSDDPVRADLEQITGAGRRAAELTRHLLAFSRQQVLAPKIVDLNDIVAGTQKMLRRLIGEDVELTAVSAPQLASVKVDPGQIEQIIMNLSVNARDAMPQGGKLTIETANVLLDETHAAEHLGLKPGPHVLLAVSDTGHGMDRATQARIFEPFFTTKEVGKGTGLGLATVFGIVQQSGGTIGVDSEPGRGTTMKVFFPAVDRIAGAAASIPPSKRRLLQGSETILLVEDEECVRVLIRTILRKCGYNVLEAQSGGDALVLCEQHSATIDLLLTDVVMPRMSGRQLSERLLVVRPEMKVLYMSGYTDDAIVRHGIVDSTIAFIQKPFTPQALIPKIREVLGSSACTGGNN